MDILEPKVAEILDKVVNALETNTPKMVEGTLTAIQVNGVVNLVIGLITLAVTLTALFFAVKTVRHIMSTAGRSDDKDDILTAITCGATIIGTILSLVFLSGSTWLAVFAPQALFANRIFDAVMKAL